MDKKLMMSFLVIAALILGASSNCLAKDEPKENQAPKVIGVDTNGDGKPDRWEYYEASILVRIEADTNNDGKVDEKAVVKNGKIVSAEKDSDYDGKVDRWIEY